MKIKEIEKELGLSRAGLNWLLHNRWAISNRHEFALEFLQSPIEPKSDTHVWEVFLEAHVNFGAIL